MIKEFIAIMLIPCSINAQNFQGPLAPSLATNTSCPFSYSSIVDYLPAENAGASDNVYAAASHCDCCDANTRCFETSGFGFNIPLTATIDGIVVEVEKKATGGSMVQDNGIKLLKAGTTVGNSQATTSNWPSSDTYYTYGSSSDLWGSSWLPEDINDPGFGLAIASISYTCFGTGTSVISSIDHVSITVYFKDVATTINDHVSKSLNQLMLSPNPYHDGLLQLTLPESDKQFHITVSDLTGHVVCENISSAPGGTVSWQVVLPPGVYLVLAKGPAGIYAQKLMVK